MKRAQKAQEVGPLFRDPFDFTAFARELRRLRADGIRAHIQAEIETTEIPGTNGVLAPSEDNEFERFAYRRKLLQLLEFLDHRQVPPALTLQERVVYWRVASALGRPSARPQASEESRVKS